MTMYLKPCKGKQTGIYNEGEVTSGNNIKSSSDSRAYHSLALLNIPDHPFPLTKMHSILEKLRFYMLLSINVQTYHAFLFHHSVHPITAVIFQLKLFCFGFVVINFLYLLLQPESVFGNLFPCFLKVNHLINSALNTILFAANFL